MRILALDDNEQDLESLRLMLTELDPEVQFDGVKSENEFLEKLKQNEDYSLLFLDIVLAGDQTQDSRGIELLELIADDYYYIPVCLISGYFIDKVREVHRKVLGNSPQFIGFLDKMDYSTKDLADIIEKAKHFSEEQKREAQEIESLQQTIRDLREGSGTPGSGDRVDREAAELVQRMFKNLYFTPEALRGDLGDQRAVRILMHINTGNEHAINAQKRQLTQGYEGYKNVWEYRCSRDGRILIGLDKGRRDVPLVTKNPPWYE